MPLDHRHRYVSSHEMDVPALIEHLAEKHSDHGKEAEDNARKLGEAHQLAHTRPIGFFPAEPWEMGK